MKRLPPFAHGLLWISPWIIGTIVFLAIPVAMSAYYSFTDYSLLEPPIPIGLANYREIAGDHEFWTSLRNTGLYTLGCAVFGTIVSVLIAVLLEQRLRGSNLVRAIVFLPTLIPIVSASIGWLWLYNGQYGLLNSLLAKFGLHGPDWLGDSRLAMPSLIFMGLWFIGSAVVICTAALREVPISLYEAADLDGMGPVTRFRHVTLPMISPAILFNGVMAAIWGIQVFAIPLVMTPKGGPENSTLVYSMYIFRNAFEYGRMGYASALAWIQFLLAILITGLALWAARRFVHYRSA
ncbi:MAG TPA: sugar ABC transporter permease [Phycisphaerales bacterium]|nr:sugar ABC transporter permease [Phycisphaerales bacterium]